MFLGIEIGGTKLQLGLGRGDGVITALWRGTVNAAEGSEGIRKQIEAAVPELLAKADLDRGELRGVGIGFGGPTDDASQTVIKSHQIDGWDGFPLRDWISDLVGVPAVLCNDADVAGLAEALFGAGKGLSPIFYITVGTGVGGGLIINGEIYRGVGKGAAEIGHLKIGVGGESLEHYASGLGIARMAREQFIAQHEHAAGMPLTRLIEDDPSRITAKILNQAAREGDAVAIAAIQEGRKALAEGIRQMIALLCPRCVVIGGGVSQMPEWLFFLQLRVDIEERVFPPFAGLTDIVPAALGEEVVVHGALALARQRFGEPCQS